MGFTLNAASDGTYHVTYDFKAGTAAKENTFSFARGTISAAPRSLIFDTSEMNAFGDEWVNIDLEFNVPSLEWKATITPENGEAIEKTGEYSNAGTYEKQNYIELNCIDNEFEYKNNSFEYYISDKAKTQKLEQNPTVIYNGAYLGSGITAALSEDLYSVKLIQSENSGYDK